MIEKNASNCNLASQNMIYNYALITFASDQKQSKNFAFHLIRERQNLSVNKMNTIVEINKICLVQNLIYSYCIASPLI